MTWTRFRRRAERSGPDDRDGIRAGRGATARRGSAAVPGAARAGRAGRPADAGRRRAGASLAGRPGRPRVAGRTGSAGVPRHDRAARALGDLPVHATAALVLPARRDHGRAADRVGRPRASPAPGQPGRRRAGRGGLRRDAVDRRGGHRPRCAVRDRQRAAAVDGRAARPAARPRRDLFHASCGYGCPGSPRATNAGTATSSSSGCGARSTAARRCSPRPRRSATPSPSRTCGNGSASW